MSVVRFELGFDYHFRTEKFIESRVKRGYQTGALVKDLTEWALKADETPVKVLHNGAVGVISVNGIEQWVSCEECELLLR